jgi:hypothetical protein
MSKLSMIKKGIKLVKNNSMADLNSIVIQINNSDFKLLSVSSKKSIAEYVEIFEAQRTSANFCLDNNNVIA